MSDKALRKELKDAAGRGLPGEEFDREVMESIQDGGGERELSAVPFLSPRRMFWGGLAAAALIGLAVFAVAGGYLTRSGGPGFTSEETAAGGRKIDLPPAETTARLPRPIKIVVTEDEEIWVKGKKYELEELPPLLAKAAAGSYDKSHAAHPSTKDVIIRADRRVRWRMIQWVMQACAHPEVRLYRLHWATAADDGKGLLPVFLPIDRGLARSSLKAEPFELPFEEEIIEEEEVEEDAIVDEPVIKDTPVEDEVIEDEITDEPFFKGGNRVKFDEGKVEKLSFPRESVKINVELKQKKDEESVRVTALGRELGTDDDGFEKLEEFARKTISVNGRLPAEVNAWAWVRFEDVVKTVDMLRKVGVRNITFVGAPPPARGAK